MNLPSKIWNEKIVAGSNGCCIFTGGVAGSGYGWLKGKFAHRLMYEECWGPIPEGLMVCHKCNVKLCVNPMHLYLGTQLQNMQDRRAAGKYGHTEESKAKISKSKLGKKHSEESVAKMREAKLGSKHTEEARLKMSEAKLRNRETGLSPEIIAKRDRRNELRRKKRE